MGWKDIGCLRSRYLCPQRFYFYVFIFALLFYLGVFTAFVFKHLLYMLQNSTAVSAISPWGLYVLFICLLYHLTDGLNTDLNPDIGNAV